MSFFKRETMPTIPNCFDDKRPDLLLWIIAFHVLGVVGISGFLITRLPDYPNCHNCIAMGRLLHAGLINLINISRHGRGHMQTRKELQFIFLHRPTAFSRRLLRWRLQCEKQILIIALSPPSLLFALHFTVNIMNTLYTKVTVWSMQYLDNPCFANLLIVFQYGWLLITD